MEGPPAAASAQALPSTTVARSRELLAAVLGPTHPLLCSYDPQGRAGLGRLLAPLPFGYLRAVVVEVVRAKGFTAALLTEAALAFASSSSSSDKADRIRFLVRLLACVAFVDPRAHGHLLVTVVPSRLLVGADPSAAHALLQGLIHATRYGVEACQAAAERVAQLGDVAIYERSIRLRAGFKRLQQRVRARLCRRLLQSEEEAAAKAGGATPAPSVCSATTASIPTTDDGPPVIDLKSLPMRITTRRPRRRSDDDQPLVLCLSTTAAAAPPSSEPTLLWSPSRSMASTDVVDGGSSAALGDEDDGAHNLNSTDLQQLIQRSWRARRRAEQQAEALAAAKRLMETDLHEAQQARARLEETLQRTLASKRRAEKALRRARQRGSDALPVVGGDGAAADGATASAADTKLNEDQQQQSNLELELKQATTLIADLRKRLRLRQEAERRHLEQWQEKLREREARVQRLAEALQRRQRQRQGLQSRLRRGAAPSPVRRPHSVPRTPVPCWSSPYATQVTTLASSSAPAPRVQLSTPAADPLEASAPAARRREDSLATLLLDTRGEDDDGGQRSPPPSTTTAAPESLPSSAPELDHVEIEEAAPASPAAVAGLFLGKASPQGKRRSRPPSLPAAIASTSIVSSPAPSFEPAAAQEQERDVHSDGREKAVEEGEQGRLTPPKQQQSSATKEGGTRAWSTSGQGRPRSRVEEVERWLESFDGRFKHSLKTFEQCMG